MNPRRPRRRTVARLALLTTAIHLLAAGTDRPLRAQQCAYPVRDTLAVSGIDTIPSPAREARDAVVAALRSRRYRVTERSDTLVAAQREGWPPLPFGLLAHFREHAHPGVTVRIALRPATGDTEMEIAVRTICGLQPKDLAHDHVSIETVARTAARDEIWIGLIEQLRARGVRPRSTADEHPAQLLGCPAPDVADTLIQVRPGDSALVTFVVDTTGAIDTSTVVVAEASSPAAAARARRLAARCSFQPAMMYGTPVRMRVTLPVRF